MGEGQRVPNSTEDWMMWMTQIVIEAKKQLRDVFGLEPSRMVDDEPCFDSVPDGLYPMEIDSKTWWAAVIEQRFHFLDKKEPK